MWFIQYSILYVIPILFQRVYIKIFSINFCLYIIYGIVKEQAGHMIPSEYETQSSYKAPGVSSETPFLKKQTYAHTKHPLVPLKQVHSEQLRITLTMKQILAVIVYTVKFYVQQQLSIVSLHMLSVTHNYCILYLLGYKMSLQIQNAIGLYELLLADIRLGSYHKPYSNMVQYY